MLSKCTYLDPEPLNPSRKFKVISVAVALFEITFALCDEHEYTVRGLLFL